MAVPSISVCNIALSEVRAAPIVSLDDQTPEARACAIHYADCLNLLLEAHDWGFATTRGLLASVLNDRSNEWTYAYALPSDCVNAGRLVDGTATPLSGVYYPWPYLWPRPPFYLGRFVIAGSTLYSNLQNAALEYVSNAVEEGRYPASFRRALELALATRLATTLLDDRTKKGDLLQQFETEKRRAMAEDLNRYPRRDLPGVDEVALVRS